MRELLARNWGLIVFRGVLGVIFGIIAVFWPGITVIALAILWGAYVLVDGLTALAFGIGGGGGVSGSGRWIMVLTGIAGVAAGIIAFVWPGKTAIVLLFVIAIWAVVVGIFQLIAAWRLRKEIQGEWLLAFTGLVSILLGVLLFLQPGSGAVALVFTIGIFAIVWGITAIVLGVRLRGIAKSDPGPIGTT